MKQNNFFKKLLIKLRNRKKNSINNKYFILISVSGLTFFLDQLTKYLILIKFYLNESIPIILGFFNLTYIQNKGAAFGLFAQSHPAFRTPFFIIVPLIALFAVSYAFSKLQVRNWKLAIALSLVIGGAVGNFVDRVRFGYVVDFLDFHWNYAYHFPAFNVADSAICVGVGVLMLDLVLQQESE